MSNHSIWPIDRTLSGATIPSQSGPGSNGNKEVLHVPQSSSITEASPSDCLVSYQGHSLVGVFLPLCRDAVGVFYGSSQQGGAFLDAEINLRIQKVSVVYRMFEKLVWLQQM